MSLSPYAQLIVEPIDGLVLTGGARIDSHSTFGEFDTHRLTAAYLLPNTETKLHASYGTGFRAPSLNELYGPFGGQHGPAARNERQLGRRLRPRVHERPARLRRDIL